MIKSEEIPTYLSEHGIKPSYQRIKIMEYLATHKTHPTVDMIFNDLCKIIPTLSKTTVYNTLKLFTEKSVALSITIEDNEVRYDGDTSTHGHFKCTQCGVIDDFQVNLDDIKVAELENYSISEHHLYLKGLCHRCKN